MKNPLAIIFYLVIILTSSCQHQDETTSNFNKTQLLLKSETSLLLDNTTTLNALGPAVSKTELAYFNNPDFSIKVYDRQDLTFIKSVPLTKDGPNALDNPKGPIYVGSNLAIYEFYQQKLKLLDIKGNVLSELDSKMRTLARSSTLPHIASPILSDSIYFYLLAQGNHLEDMRINHDDNVIKRINLKTGEIDLFGNYPEAYVNPISGGRQSIITSTLNTKTNSLIYSFPLEHGIFELTQAGELIKHNQPATIFDDFDGHYFPSFNQITQKSYPEMKRKFWSNYSYWSILYDEKNDVYLRAVNLPITEERYKNSNSVKESEVRSYKFIIYNGEFEIVGISDPIDDIDLTIESGKSFTNQDGIHFFKKQQDNENIMQFKTYQIRNR